MEDTAETTAATASTGPAPVTHAGGDATEDGCGEGGDDQEEKAAATAGGARRAQPPTRIACQRCRSIKVRCQPQEPTGSGGKCVRCNRLKFECIWVEPQKRGRKATVSRSSQAPAPPPGTTEGNSQAPRRSSSITADPLNRPESEPPQDRLALLAATATPQLSQTQSPVIQPSFGGVTLTPAPPTFSLPPPAPATNNVQAPVPSTSQQLYNSQTLQQPYTLPPINPAFYPHASQLTHPSPPAFSPHASSTHSGGHKSYGSPGSLLSETAPRPSLPSLSMIELSQAKEAALQSLTVVASENVKTSPRLPLPQALREPDPIDMHVLGSLEAKQLFDHYHTQMNAFIILLDPFLHTVSYCRETSTVLFTSILAAAAKFVRPDLYPQLIMSAKQLVGRAIIDGRASLGLIQSILLQVYWKEPEDSSAWLRVGEAIRIGYQLHLHAHRTAPLPDDEFAAREIMDRERTWIDLCAFDQTFFLQSGDDDDGFHQTCMIPCFRINVVSWLEETKAYGVTDDLEQAADFEWMKINRLSRDINRSRPAHARSLGDHIQGMLENSYSRYLDQTSPHAFQQGTRAWTRVNFWLAAASVALSRSLLIAVGTDSSDALAKWVLASGVFVDAFEVIARAGFISYWQDTLGITLFSFGEFCVKVFNKVYPANQRAILSWLERVFRACDAAARGRTDSTAAFISRFFQVCLRVVCSPTSSPEAAVAAANAAGVAAMPPPPPSQAFPQTQSFVGNGDASYWESLFPGHATDWSWLDQPLDDLMKA